MSHVIRNQIFNLPEGSYSSSGSWTPQYYTLKSGAIWYRREINNVGGYFALDYSEDAGVTWENLVTLDLTESDPIIDLAHIYRHRIVNYAYHVDQTLTATGYAGTEGVDWEMIGVYSGADLSFIIEIETTSPNQTIVLPHKGGLIYNYIVDYGDGTPPLSVLTYNSANVTHVYVSVGTYIIKILGMCESFEVDLGDANIPLVLTKIISWGSVGLKRLNFYNCTLLNSIAGDTYAGLSLLTSFYNVFYNSIITTIPSNLFKYCTEVTTFQAVFDACQLIIEIPVGLFNSCTKVTDFSIAFDDCALLEIIPSGLFDHCPLITTFFVTFQNTALTSIPSGLFDYCVNAKSMASTFKNTEITSIPYDIFDHQVLTNIRSTFEGCSLLEGNAPALWNTYSDVVGLGCFIGCVGLNNYATIPAAWK